MLDTFLNNIYLTPLLGVIPGWIIVYLYNWAEKKNYTKSDYFKFGLVIYIATLTAIYLFRSMGDKTLNLSNPNELLATIPVITAIGSNVAAAMVTGTNDLIDDSQVFNIGHPNF